MKTTKNELSKLFAYKYAWTAIAHCKGDKVLIEAVNIHFKRKSEPVISVKEFCNNLIEIKANKLLSAIPDERYSMGSMIVLRVGKKEFYQDRTSEYSGSKYRANHGRVVVELTPYEFRYAKNIGGLLTVTLPQKSKVKKCFWFEGHGSKQYFELVKVDGFIFEGFHAKTKKEALEGGVKIIERKKLAEKAQKSINKAMRRQYTFADSLLAGNCEAGTRAFILRLGLNSDLKYRGTYLLKIAEEKSSSSVYYVKRMISFFAK